MNAVKALVVTGGPQLRAVRGEARARSVADTAQPEILADDNIRDGAHRPAARVGIAAPDRLTGRPLP